MSRAAHAWGHLPPEGQGESRKSDCRECLAGLAHCHGTVIHHAYDRVECTEQGCETPDVVHAFSVDCEAIGCRCDAEVAAVSAHRVG